MTRGPLNTETLKDLLKGSLFSLFCTLVVCLIHMNMADSFLSEISLEKIIAFHRENPVFLRRPVTTFLIEAISVFTRLSEARAFVLVNFFFLFANGVLIFLISDCFNQTFREKIINLFVYFTSASILFAFYQPVYSYDEPVQYFFIFLSLLFCLKEKTSLFVVFFFLALVSRETSIVLIPAFFGILLHKRKVRSIKAIAILLVPAIMYAIYLVIFIQYRHLTELTKDDTLSRFNDFLFNFSDLPHALETIFSMAMVLGLPVYFLSQNRIRAFHGLEKSILRSFILIVILNTILILLTAKAREFRLFALPLCLFWPLAARIFSTSLNTEFQNAGRVFFDLKYVVIFLIWSCANYFVSIVVYRTTIGNPGDNYFNEYLFLVLTFVGMHLVGRFSPKVRN